MTTQDPSSPSSLDLTILSTLSLLESRLHRLTYLLTGDTTWTGVPNAPAKPISHEETVSRRLLKLEQELGALASSVPVVGDVVGLYDRFPDLFRAQSQSQSQSQLQPSSTSTQQDDPSDPSSEQPEPSSPDSDLSDLPLETLTSIILSYASLIPETASRLSSLNDLPIPDATLSSSLISLQPRMQQLQQTQDKQGRDVAELRVRSAKVLQRVYEVGILGAGEVWGEWEGRLEGVERGVRRGEVGREREGV